MRTGSRGNKLVYLGFIIIFLTCPLLSQNIEQGKIMGTVVDEEGAPLPGVKVEISGSALIGGKRTAQTTAKGSYIFKNLQPGKYVLTASFPGFKTTKQENITVTAGASVVVEVKMEIGKPEEMITRNQPGPVVEAKASTAAINLPSELLAKLPTSRDAFYDLALTTPGMVSQGKDGSWLPSPNAYGSASNENVFLINGVNTTDPKSSAYGSLVAVNYNAVEEVRIIALGSKAEYGSYSGAVIDVLTRSGGNDFHGNLMANWVPKNWVADNQPKPATPGTAVDLGPLGPFGDRLVIAAGDELLTKSLREYEFNLTGGGPVIKDKIWFYAGAAYIRKQSDIPFWSISNNYWGRLGDIKLTTKLGTKHQARIAYHYEWNKNDGCTLDPHWDETMNYGQNSKAYSVSAQWQFTASDRTVFTMKYLGFGRDDQPFIPTDAPDHPGFVNWGKWASFGINGAFPFIESPKSSRNTFQADMSYYTEKFLGEQEIKVGVQYTLSSGNLLGGYFYNYANFAYPAPDSQNINYLRDHYGATGLVFYNDQTWLNPFLTVRTADQFGVFLDDQWTPTRRLTINLGLRFDRMTAKYGKGKVYDYLTEPEEINGGLKVIRDREGSGNIFDFKLFSPRIGLTYALTRDMKTIFRISYGRYYLPLSVEYLRKFGPDMPTARINRLWYNIPFELVDLDGDNWISSEETINAARYLYGDTYVTGSEEKEEDWSWQLKLKDGTKDQHTDMITVSLEREIVSNLSLSATYIWKRAGNILVSWPVNSETQEPFEYERKSYTTQYGETVSLYSVVLEDYNEDGTIDGSDIGWVNNHLDYLVQNMSTIDEIKPRRLYQGLQFILNKRYSKRWQLMASALFSWSDGFAMRSLRQDFNFEGPVVMDTLFLAGLNQTINNLKGPLPHTQKFEAKLSGAYRLPLIEMDIGFRFRYNSGRPFWPLETYPAISESNYPNGLVVNTGDNYIVSIEPTKPWYLPHERILDLRLDKAFTLKGAGILRLAVDILNLFNEHAVVNVGYGGSIEPVIGKVSGLTYPSRKIRLNISYEF